MRFEAGLATRTTLSDLKLRRSIVGTLIRDQEETLCVLNEENAEGLRDKGFRMQLTLI